MPETMNSIAHSRAVSGGDRKRWIALFVVCLAMLMIVLDASIVNVALPSIQHEPALLARPT